MSPIPSPDSRSSRLVSRLQVFGASQLGAILLVAFFLGIIGVGGLLEPMPLAAQEGGGEVADETPGHERELLSGTRQLTFEGRRAGEGYFNADGTQLVFQSERDPENPFFQIFLLHLETGDVELVSTGRGKTTCAWIHPSGRRVLFASTHEDPRTRENEKAELEARAEGRERRYSWDYDESFDIYERILTSGELRPLTRERGYDAEGSYSPDGRRIAFSSNRHAYLADALSPQDQERLSVDPSYFLDIYIMDVDGKNVRRLTDVPGYDGGPFFSPDGERICWRRFSEDGATAEVMTMRIDGSDVRQITQLGAMSWAPFYHPSGEYLIFTTNRHGFANFELYLVDVEGERQPVRVTETPGFDGLPVFRPGGKELFWTTNRTTGKDSQIFAARWDHDRARELLAASRPIRTTPLGAGEELIRRAGAKPTEEAIRVEDLEQHILTLAAGELEGRGTGTPGEVLATRYVAARFAKLGLEPAGTDGSWYQEFPFTAGVALGDSSRARLGTADGSVRELAVNEQWRPLAFSENGEVASSGLVFAGYGIVAPKAEASDEYDSYVHLDVKDRWVLVLRFLPEGVTPERRQHLARHSSLRYKAMVARERGARGLIVASGPTSKVRESLVPLRFDASLAGASLPAISIDDAIASELLLAAGKSLAETQAALDSGEPMAGFAIPDLSFSANIDVAKVEKTGRNVLARLRARGPREKRLAPVYLGAHVDHLGRGESGSLARDDEKGEIHFGADDNASGVAAVLEVAEQLVGLERAGRLALARDVVFAAWSGEELGLLGSRHYTESLAAHAHASPHADAPPVGAAGAAGGAKTPSGPHGEAPAPHAHAATGLAGVVAAYINLDMVGRLKDRVVLQGVGSSSVWRREIERRNAPIGLPIALSEESYLPTDATSFYLRGVPILSVFTGSHSEYHTPRDTPDLINWEGLREITRFVALVVRGLALSEESPDYIEQEAPTKGGERAGLRVYLGTIPDYVEPPIPGLRLSGVAKGGPAADAKLLAGDIIVELAGRKIANIYDYTYAIDALKVGVEVDVVVVRGDPAEGKRVKLKLTPRSRQ